MFSKQSSDSWLIVGLGNPGREYEKTRHNTGFRAMDILAEKLNAKVDRLKFQGLYTQVNYGGKKLFLLKPQTYMNLSGRSVLQLSAYFGIPPQRIIVMFDDISLEPGRLRVRAEGSAGGHNGIKSIIQELGSQDFPRVKIGVGAKPNPEYDLAAWVLSTFSASEEKALAVLNAVRAANRTARHNVYAYVLQNGRTRYSDDGEPAKTAGTPVLETIGHAGVADVIVVVTRYFGGILLGTGGLVRAYTAAASGALQKAELVSMRLVVDCSVRVSYAQFEQAQRIIAAAETRLDEPIFDDAVTLCWRMPAGQEETLRTDLNELTRGGAEVEISAPQYAAF